MWPHVERPDIFISLGTGTEKSLEGPDAPDSTHLFQDGFIPRFYRSFLSSLDGQGTWQELINGLEEPTREVCIRLNIVLPGRSLAIDDTECMDDLLDAIYSCSTLDNSIKMTATS